MGTGRRGNRVDNGKGGGMKSRMRAWSPRVNGVPRRPSGVAAVVTMLVAAAAMAASCGGAPATTTTSGTDAPPSSIATTTSTGLPATTTGTTLPGEPFDIGPREGDVVAVIGVAHDDALNVRALPGNGEATVTSLPPTTDDVVSLGRSRLLPGSIWLEVRVGGVTGWVNSSFVAYLGGVDDVTSSVVAAAGGIPVAETMLDLGLLAADTMASEDPPSRIVMTVAPTVTDLGEVTYDVIGLGDDAVRGVRLHVFGEPMPGGEGFSLKSVESTVLCGRGVTADGLCI